MPQQIDDKLVQEYKQVFNLYDADNSGAINSAELGNVMRSLGQTPSQGEVQRILEEFDADKSGSIEFSEFLNIMRSHWKQPCSSEELKESFQLIDANGDGTVTLTELKAFLCNFGEALTEDEVERVVKRYDIDKNGKLNYSEFINMLLRA